MSKVPSYVRCEYTELVPVEEMKPWDKNPNRHPKDQIKAIAEVLKIQGIRKPAIVDDADGVMVTAHGTLEAVKLLGWPLMPVSRQLFKDKSHAYAHMVADNALGQRSKLDLKAINVELPEIGPIEIDLLGIKDFKVDPSERDGDDEVPPVRKKAKAKLGQVWALGDHRLMCGDSTKEEDVSRLMDGHRADLLVTDPPYGVDYAGKNRFLNSVALGKRIQEPILADAQTPDEMNDFWCQALTRAHAAMSDKASYYICSPQRGDLMMMMSIIHAGFQLKHMLVWVKNNHVLGRCDYNYRHEPILYGWKDGKTHDFVGEGSCKTSVWEFDKPLKNDLHPTMKPVALCEEAVLNGARQGGAVLDLFGGSGSTLIACEKTNRRCFMMELDPCYIDVIIARWEKFTGKKARLADAGIARR